MFLPGFHTVVSAVRIPPPFVILLFYQQQRLQVLVLRPYAMLIVSQQRSSIAAPRKGYELGGRGCQDTGFFIYALPVGPLLFVSSQSFPMFFFSLDKSNTFEAKVWLLRGWESWGAHAHLLSFSLLSDWYSVPFFIPFLSNPNTNWYKSSFSFFLLETSKHLNSSLERLAVSKQAQTRLEL